MNPTMVGDPSVSLTAAPAFSGNTGTLRFLNYSPYALAVSLRRGTFVVPPYCPRDLRVDVYENIQWTLQYQLAGVSKNPASYLVIEAYDEGEDIPQLPPSFSCPLVNIGNTTPVATSAQQVDATFSTSTTTPQVMTATAGTGLGVEDQKASGYIELYPTATDATARGIALGYIDTSGVLHIGVIEDTGGNLTAASVNGTIGLNLLKRTAGSAANTDTLSLQRLGSFGTGQYTFGLDSSGNLYLFDNGNNAFVLQSTNKNGLGIIAPISQVGGQATAGSFGVPVIVGDSGAVLHVTDVLAHTLINITLAADGQYRINATYESHNSAAATPKMVVNFTDANGSADFVFYPADNPAGGVGGKAVYSPMDGATVSIGAGSGAVSVMPVVVWAKAGTLTVVFTEVGGGTVSDFVSATVERLH